MELILNGNDNGVIRQVDDYLLRLNSPKNFDYSDSENDLIKLKKSFTIACTALEEMGIKSPELLTLYEFIEKSDYYERKNKLK